MVNQWLEQIFDAWISFQKKERMQILSVVLVFVGFVVIKCRGGRGAILPDGVGEVGTFRLRNREKGFGGFVTK